MRRMVTTPIAVLMAVFLAAPLAVEAQPAGSVYRIGFLGPASAERVYTVPLRSLRAGLRELRWASRSRRRCSYGQTRL